MCNFPNVQFPKRQLLKGQVNGEASAAARTGQEGLALWLGHAWEVATWEAATWEPATWENTLGKLPLKKMSEGKYRTLKK